MTSAPLTPEIKHLNDLIREYGNQVATTGEKDIPPELVAAIAAMVYIPPEMLHTSDYNSHFRHGYNICRKEVINRGPL